MLSHNLHRRHTSYYPTARITKQTSLDSFPLNKLANYQSNVIVNKTPTKTIIENKYILVVQEPDGDTYMQDILENLGVKVTNKTYVEKYLIYSIKATNEVINEIKKYSWFVNLSKAQ